MKFSSSFLVFSCVGRLTIALLLSGTGAAAQNYSLTDLGTLGGTASQAGGINGSGIIVGVAEAADGSDHAFRFANGRMLDLGIKSSLSLGTAIIHSGPAAGYYYDRQYRAFVMTQSKLKDLGDLGDNYSVAYAINSLGHACGSSLIKQGLYGAERAFLWTGGRMVNLGTLGGNYSSARGVNRNDEVAGYAYLATGAFRAFRWANSVMVDLGTLGGDYSNANAINDSGQIAGAASLAGNAGSHACLWNRTGPPLDLGTLGDINSEALALTSTPLAIVGRATVPSNTGFVLYHAFVWSGGTMQDLNALIPANSGWVLNEATGVNDSGAIVGNGTIAGQTHAFLLTPR